MANEQKTNYLAKLLTLLVKRDGGAIKIPVQDLMIDDIGQGFQVHFSQETKELVLTFVPAGSTTYKIEGATTWLTNQVLPQSRQEPLPLTREDLLAKVWTDSSGTPTVEEGLRPKERKNKVLHLTSEGQAEAELERRKASLLRELEDYQSPQPPASRTHSARVTAFSKP